MVVYKSPYEAYPFLSDKGNDYRCDFEILTDKICSRTGLLYAMVKAKKYDEVAQSLLKVGELVYHVNPSLRTFCSITLDEVLWLKHEIDCLQSKANSTGFVLPHGSESACIAHILRTEGKELVRLLYRYMETGKEVSTDLIDFCNLLSGYYFSLALYLNQLEKMDEIPFVSRNYK